MQKRPLCLAAMFLLLCFWILPEDIWFEKPDIPSGEKVLITGEVVKREQREETCVYYLKDCHCDRTNSEFSVLAYTQKGDSYPVGCELSLYGTVYQLNKADNPGQFDGQRYYQSQGILYTFQTISVHSVQGGSVIREGVTLCREFLCEILESIYSERDAGILKAAILGDQTSLREEDEMLYRKCGISHLLAISGLHVSMIGMGLYRFLRKCRLTFWEAGIPSGTILVFYGMMTGFGISTIRAVCMFLVLITADIFGRAYDMASGMALAAIVILLRNPLQAGSAGFLLSFGAVFGICCVYPILQTTISSENKLLRTLLFSISISLATYPLTVHFFYEYPVYSILLNFIVIPCMPVVMGFGAAGMLAGICSQSAGQLLGMPAHAVLSCYEGLCKMILKLPYPVVRLGCEKPWQLVVCYALLSAALLGLWYGRRKIWGWLLPVGILIVTIRFHPGMEYTLLDVGQGDGMFFRMPDGTICLIDGGSLSEKNLGEYRLLPYLKYEGVSVIDYVILTHLDEDHISGIRELLMMSTGPDSVRIRTMLFPGIKNPDEVYQEMWELAKQCQVEVQVIGTGDSLRGEEWALECLSPDKGSFCEDKNESSVVLQMNYGDFSMFLGGDCGYQTEKRLIQEGVLQKVDVWKVSHHGSNYSGSEEFIQMIRPRLSLISVGRNRYGHPGEELLERLDKAGSSVKTTIENGALRLHSDGRVYTLFLQREDD